MSEPRRISIGVKMLITAGGALVCAAGSCGAYLLAHKGNSRSSSAIAEIFAGLFIVSVIAIPVLFIAAIVAEIVTAKKKTGAPQ